MLYVELFSKTLFITLEYTLNKVFFNKLDSIVLFVTKYINCMKFFCLDINKWEFFLKKLFSHRTYISHTHNLIKSKFKLLKRKLSKFSSNVTEAQRVQALVRIYILYLDWHPICINYWNLHIKDPNFFLWRQVEGHFPPSSHMLSFRSSGPWMLFHLFHFLTNKVAIT